MGVGSSFLTGPETLGIALEQEYPDSPTFGQRSTPRMIVEQFWRLLKPIREATDNRFFEILQTLFEAADPGQFYLVYLVVFVELHEVEVICRDRRRHGTENKTEVWASQQPRAKGTTLTQQTLYSLPQYVQELQCKALELIHHFHAYKQRCFPGARLRDQLDTGYAPNATFISQCAQHVLQSGKSKASPFPRLRFSQNPIADWLAIDIMSRPMTARAPEDQFYFVAQMHEDNWTPWPVYFYQTNSLHAVNQ